MAERKKIAAVLFNGFEVLDVFGPLEAFGMLSYFGDWEVVTVAEKGGAAASAQGPKTLTDFSFENCPPLEMFLVPGGMGTREEIKNETMLQFLRDRSESAQRVMSVCTGSAILATAGLLDGRRATTNKAVFKWVADQGPKVNWIKEARWVDDGKFSTSSGVSAGIDMALSVVERTAGKETAERIATQMEYDWHRDAGWDPFAKIHGLVD